MERGQTERLEGRVPSATARVRVTPGGATQKDGQVAYHDTLPTPHTPELSPTLSQACPDGSLSASRRECISPESLPLQGLTTSLGGPFDIVLARSFMDLVGILDGGFDDKVCG